jgi:DNA polymerase-4
MRVAEPILHVDMDAFYASVEVVKDPSLKGKPLMVTSASYEARAFGVHSAMPMVRAIRLCPHAELRSNDFPSYLEYSKLIREVFLSFTPLVEPLSLDEAFLDVAGSVKIFGPPVEIGRQIKHQIAGLGLGCTVGVAPTKFLAKLASDAAKPDGLLVVPADRVTEFLHPLPVKALWGVGERTGEVLTRLGLRTVADIAMMPKRTLERAVGESLGQHLHNLANGIDERAVKPHEAAKSVGSEETFARDLDDTTEIVREILRLADRTAGRLRSSGHSGRTVTLKVRFSNFSTITRSRTLGHDTNTTAEIYEVARALYLKLDPQRPRIRLLGVSVTGLTIGAPLRQLELGVGSDGAGWDEASKAVDDLRRRFGERSVGLGTLLEEPRPDEGGSLE